MKRILKRIYTSFATSAICGLLVNLIIDISVNSVSEEPFTSIPPSFLEYFRTPAMAAYVNVLLYGLIGTVFGGLSIIYECDRIGFVVQNIIYFLGTSIVWLFISIVLWQLQKIPEALISTISGYAVTYIIITVIMYRNMKKSVSQVNSLLDYKK